jgi:uncharacterized membrane protein YhaH (DUF805 family)
MNMQDAVASVFRNYATFSGRARRAEYWWFVLFSIIVSAILSVIDGALFGYSFTNETGPGSAAFAYSSPGVLPAIWSLATFLPALAVAVRRLHDTGRSGWWLLIFLVPLIGLILLLVWFAARGTPGTNAHGPDPIAGEGWA